MKTKLAQSKSLLNAKAKIRRSVGSQMISLKFKQGDFIPNFITVGFADYKIIGNFKDGFFAMFYAMNENKVQQFRNKYK